MIISETRKLIKKLFVLGVLVAGLGLLSAGARTNASTDAGNNFLPCCSYCDEHFGAPICSHGCSESCRTTQ